MTNSNLDTCSIGTSINPILATCTTKQNKTIVLYCFVSSNV